MFCQIDQWHGLTMEDIRAIEEKNKHELNEVWYLELPSLFLTSTRVNKTTCSLGNTVTSL